MCFELQERFAEVTINDPVNGDIIGYIYLFENTGEVVAPDAGEKLVLYDFKLTKDGDYFNNYTFTCPEFGLSPEGYIHACLNYTTNPITNAEDSWIHTPHYNRHFAENWWVHIYYLDLLN